MIQLPSLLSYLDSLLQPKLYQDVALNGLQVESGTETIRTVAFAVDCGKSIVEAAVKKEADMLIVHHGLFWGTEQAITGPLAQKISLLLSNGCSLFASHLPLDGNAEVGNGFELARHIGLENIEGFCEYLGQTVGALGSLPKPLSRSEIVGKLKEIEGALESPLLLPFGKEEVKSIGVVTGSGAFAIPLCKEMGIDLLISGEPKQEAYHLAKELEVNALFAGHYATETFGVRALSRRIEQDFDVSTVFIEEPTGI